MLTTSELEEAIRAEQAKAADPALIAAIMAAHEAALTIAAGDDETAKWCVTSFDCAMQAIATLCVSGRLNLVMGMINNMFRLADIMDRLKLPGSPHYQKTALGMHQIFSRLNELNDMKLALEKEQADQQVSQVAQQGDKPTIH